MSCRSFGTSSKEMAELQEIIDKTEKVEHPFTVYTLGRICYQKNPTLFNEIAESLPDVKFVWIGDGELRDQLTSENIEITGWADRSTAIRYAVNADVFLLPSRWEEPIIKGKYILCYFLGNNPPHREFAKRLKEVTGCKIIALTHLDEFVKSDEGYADETPYDIDPADFLNLIRNAEYVCTDSFHCSVFSILYKRQFFTFRRYNRNTKQSTNSRLDTLFHMAGITGRLLTGEENIANCLKIETDFESVHKKLEGIRQKSYQYLLSALKDEGSTDL